MKNVLLLGATGTAGSAITQKLLNDTDCHITLFARHAMDADISNKRVTAINGDATNEVDLRTALKGARCCLLRHFRRATPDCRPKSCDNNAGMWCRAVDFHGRSRYL